MCNLNNVSNKWFDTASGLWSRKNRGDTLEVGYLLETTISNASHASVVNEIVHSDVVRASPVGAAPTTSSFAT